MSNIIAVVGLQYGDENKKSITNYLEQDADIVLDYQSYDDSDSDEESVSGKLNLSTIPHGFVNQDVMNIISAGAIINPDAIQRELKEIEKQTGAAVENLFIDKRTHLILPYHFTDNDTHSNATARALIDKIEGIGIRAGDLLDEENLKIKIRMLVAKRNIQEKADKILSACNNWKKIFAPYIIDTIPIIKYSVENDDKILLIGRHGILHDINHGLYPHTGFSGCTLSSACDAAGLPCTKINRTIGVAGTYTTTFSTASFPTEFEKDEIKLINDYDINKRYGWLDAVSLEYAIYMNGITDLAITNLNELDTFKMIKICTGYMIEGEYYSNFPEPELVGKAKPLYEEYPGWLEDTTGCKSFSELPKEARAYILKIEELLNIKCSYISVGNTINQIIAR